MKFNRVKQLTTDKGQFMEALKDSSVVEMSPDHTGIRKKLPAAGK